MKLRITKEEYKLLLASLEYQKWLLNGYAIREREKISLIIKKLKRKNQNEQRRRSNTNDVRKVV